MADKKTAELAEMNLAELVQRLAEEKDNYFKLRFKHATGQLPDSAKLRQSRRQVARVSTVLRAKEIAAAEAAAKETT
jgi:large subunit ribosomal protein L29